MESGDWQHSVGDTMPMSGAGAQPDSGIAWLPHCQDASSKVADGMDATMMDSATLNSG